LGCALEHADQKPYSLTASLPLLPPSLTPCLTYFRGPTLNAQGWVPLPGVFDPAFVASNQNSRPNHTISGNKQEQLEQIIEDIRQGVNLLRERHLR